MYAVCLVFVVISCYSEVTLGTDVFENDLNVQLRKLLTQFNIEELHITGVDGDPGVTTASYTCLNDTQNIIDGVIEEKKWALQMFDAFGKPGSGILRGELGWLGSFDECLDVVPPKSEVNFLGKYCSATLTPPSLNQSAFNPSTTPPAIIIIGLCMPDTCTDVDVNNIVVNALRSQNISLLTTIACHQRDYPLDTEAIVAIVICSLFACLVVLGTVCDVLSSELRHNRELIKQEPPGKYYKIADETKQVTETETPQHDVHVNPVSVEAIPPVQKTHTKNSGEHKDEPKWMTLLKSFSVYTNGAKLLNTKQSPGSLTAVHGIRFISMTWIILGHTFASLPFYGSNAGPYILDHIKDWTAQAILNANVSVDSFFALSGLLVTYLTLKELKKTGGKLNWFMFYFHRFWRLTPVYMMVIMIYTCLLHYFADGPIWAQTGFVKEECRKNWWTNLLYVNNLVGMDNQCFLWGWYLANDMQFYIISPLIILPLFFSEVIGLLVLGALLAGSIIATGVISRLNNQTAGDLYEAVRVMLVWMVAASSALAVLYGPFESANGQPMSYDVAALYNAMKRSVWGAAVSWVVVACASGSGGYVNSFLSWSGFVPLSRLTYTAYLTHNLVITMQIMSMRKIFYLSDINIIFTYLGFLLATYALSVVVSLTFEVPMMGLEKVLLKRRSRND